MGRPRRPYNGVEAIVGIEPKWMKAHYPGKLGVRQEQRWDASTNWTYKSVNGIYDPLTYLHVLDVLTGIDPDIELRSKNLVDYLMFHRDQFVWDAVTVGKVLSDLAESFEDVLGEKRGLLERGKDYKGTFYRIHHDEDVARVFYALREDLMKLVAIEMTERDRGNRSPRLVSPLLECPSVRTDFAEAI